MRIMYQKLLLSAREIWGASMVANNQSEMPWRFLVYRESAKTNLIYNAVFNRYHEGRLIVELAEEVFNLPPDCWRVVPVEE